MQGLKYKVVVAFTLLISILGTLQKAQADQSTFVATPTMAMPPNFIRFISANKPKINFKQAYLSPLSMGGIEMNFRIFLEALSRQSGLNFIIDKDINGYQHNYTFNLKHKSTGEVLQILTVAECLIVSPIQTYRFQPNEEIITDTLFIHQAPAQVACNQPNDLEKLSTYFPQLNSLQGMDLENSDFKAILRLLSFQANLNIVFQDLDNIDSKYKINVRDKSISSIFKATLNATCLSYRKLNSNTILIFKDPNQKDCKLLPAGSEIIVK